MTRATTIARHIVPYLALLALVGALFYGVGGNERAHAQFPSRKATVAVSTSP